MPERQGLCAVRQEMLQVRKEKSLLQRLHLETLVEMGMLRTRDVPLSCGTAQ
jgi:hypothetical protein